MDRRSRKPSEGKHKPRQQAPLGMSLGEELLIYNGSSTAGHITPFAFGAKILTTACRTTVCEPLNRAPQHGRCGRRGESGGEHGERSGSQDSQEVASVEVSLNGVCVYERVGAEVVSKVVEPIILQTFSVTRYQEQAVDYRRIRLVGRRRCGQRMQGCRHARYSQKGMSGRVE